MNPFPGKVLAWPVPALIASWEGFPGAGRACVFWEVRVIGEHPRPGKGRGHWMRQDPSVSLAQGFHGERKPLKGGVMVSTETKQSFIQEQEKCAPGVETGQLKRSFQKLPPAHSVRPHMGTCAYTDTHIHTRTLHCKTNQCIKTNTMFSLFAISAIGRCILLAARWKHGGALFAALIFDTSQSGPYHSPSQLCSRSNHFITSRRLPCGSHHFL